jgi:hypothetical protein
MGRGLTTADAIDVFGAMLRTGIVLFGTSQGVFLLHRDVILATGIAFDELFPETI